MLEPLADRSLACRLAGSVDAERPERIVLRVGPGLGAIEHVVGGKVEERASDRGRRLGQTGGPSALTANAACGSASARSTAV